MRTREQPSAEAQQARYEARIAELARYTGDACTKVPGHGSERYTSNGCCVRCVAASSLRHWHELGKDRAVIRRASTPKAQAKAAKYEYKGSGIDYAHKRDPKNAYPWLADAELRWQWRAGYVHATGRTGQDMPLAEARQLVHEARRLWLAPSFVGCQHVDLI
jgi:hypothetical protein